MKTKIQTETVTLPAHWTSALINGDYSGCDKQETQNINAWLRDNPHYAECLTCSEYPELRQFDGLLTECLDYTFPVVMTRNAGDVEYLVYPAHRFSEPLPWQQAGLTYTATGYGRKIPTSNCVSLNGRRYRIYCTIYSNIGTCWINYMGRRVVVE